MFALQFLLYFNSIELNILVFRAEIYWHICDADQKTLLRNVFGFHLVLMEKGMNEEDATNSSHPNLTGPLFYSL